MNFTRFIFAGVILYFYIFSITPVFLTVNTSMLIVFIGVIYSLCNIRNFTICISNIVDFLPTFFLLLLAGVMCASFSFFFGNEEIIWLGFGFKFITAAAFSLIFYCEFVRGKFSDIGGFFYLLDIFLLTCFVQALTVLATYFNEEIRILIESNVQNRGNIETGSLLRYKGLHDSGGFGLSLILSIGCIYSFYSTVFLRARFRFLRIISFLIILLAITLVGRTGLVLTLIVVPFLAIFRLYSGVVFVMNILGLVLIFYLLSSFVNPASVDLYFDQIIFYAFELFYNIADGHGAKADSLDDLYSMYFLPDFYTFLFGSGSFDSESNGVARSDSGYLKTLLSGGLFTFLIVYASYGYLATKCAILLKENKNQFYFFLTYIAILLVSEFKAPVFIQNESSRLFILLCAAVFCGCKRGKIYN